MVGVLCLMEIMLTLMIIEIFTLKRILIPQKYSEGFFY